jgi:hypothetical protein
MRPLRHFTPADDHAATDRRCWRCLTNGEACSVLTMHGRFIVSVTLRCPLCGHEWNVAPKSQTSLDQSRDPPESS